jgi:hypothetical protein
MVNDYIEIISLDELKTHGIRCAIYSASCIDINGLFYGDVGYDQKKNTPFVVKHHIIQSLPRIPSDDVNEVNSVISSMTSEIKQSLITELKSRLAYVSSVAYLLTPCLCGEEQCKKHYSPSVRGFDKLRYEQYIEKIKKEHEHKN